jgi:hypothetical protein
LIRPSGREDNERTCENPADGKYKRYEILFAVRSLNEILKSLIKNERHFYATVGIMVVFSLILMLLGVLTHFGIVSFKVNLGKVGPAVARIFKK